MAGEKLQVYKDGSALYAKTKTGYVATPNGDSDEYRYLFAPQIDILRQSRHDYPYSNWYGKAVNIVFFSDIHGDGINFARIVDFWKSLPLETTCLCGGDMVWVNPGSDAMNFWDNVEGSEDILRCIGNHDWKSGGAQSCYETYFAENIANWGVTYTPNVCYYYKDYATEKLRLIVLDCMDWDTAQYNWLVATLAGAKTNNYHVVCVSHYCPGAGAEKSTCSFDTISLAARYFISAIDAQASAAVQDFIDAGGHFVCWLGGHIHSDVFREVTAYPTQLMVLVANASSAEHVQGAAGCQLARVDNTRSQDLYDMLAISTEDSILTITRVGADHDNFGRHIGTVVYDYANNQILWND